jgi:hypothetical protein
MTDSFSREALYAHAAQIAAHPGFAAAKARHTHVGLDVVDGKPVVAKLACQISRYATLAMILCYYDLAESGNAQGGVTSSTVLAAIGRTPFASRSWAKLMVRVYHRAGMIAYDPPGPDRRARPFHPTPELLAMGQQAIGIFFEALALVDALPGDPAELAQRPGVLTGMARALVDTYFKHRFTMLEASPEIGALFKREFGYLIADMRKVLHQPLQNPLRFLSFFGAVFQLHKVVPLEGAKLCFEGFEPGSDVTRFRS